MPVDTVSKLLYVFGESSKAVCLRQRLRLPHIGQGCSSHSSDGEKQTGLIEHSTCLTLRVAGLRVNPPSPFGQPSGFPTPSASLESPRFCHEAVRQTRFVRQ